MEEKREEKILEIGRSPGLAGRHVIKDAIITPGGLYHIAERTETPPEGGIYVYYQGMPFPKKGYPFPEAAFANDNLKRVTRYLLTLISGKEMVLPLLVFAILPWKIKLRKIERMIDEYIRVATWLQNECYLETDRYSYPAKEVGGFVYEFLVALEMDKGLLKITSDTGEEIGMIRERGIDSPPIWVSMKENHQSYVWAMARVVATIFEHDDAYRLRMEDIASEVNQAALVQDPRAEIKRLTQIFASREKTHATDMVKRFSQVFSLLLLHPKIKKAFRKAVVKVNFERLGLDNADRYHVLQRGDYDFTGRSVEDRKRIFGEFHMLSNCCNERLRFTKDKDGNTVAGHCKKCFKSLEPTEVHFDIPPMVEVAPGQ